MFKRILALMLWLSGSSVCVAQSINYVSPTLLSTDGNNTTNTKVLVLPQVQTTPLGTPTPQTSAWYQLNGNGAALVEFQTNTFSGYYAAQVSDNPTPVSTPGLGIYTVTRDASTYASGGQGGETDTWAYMIKDGWKWIRFIANPDTSNTGTLNIQVRLFGNPVAGDAVRSYSSGVPWKSAENLLNNAVQTGAGTNYYDYKLPVGAKGLNIYTNIVGVSAASTITTTVNVKDPFTGQLQSIGVGQASHVAGFSTILVTDAYAAPYPVATPPAGLTVLSYKLPQDIVIQNGYTGTGATTITQTVSPLN